MVEALHDILCGVLGAPFPDGDNHCYFEPPDGKDMKYPCIVYHYTNDDDDFADNIHYRRSKRYTVTVIDYDPDSKIPDQLSSVLSYCTSDRSFTSDGLRHFVFTLYFSGPRIKEENNEQNQMGSDRSKKV